jgi:alkylation response protein AidB-like acyl-CoA dehydrogenase
MDFDLTDDHRMLRDSLTRYLAEQYPIEHRNRVAYDAPYHDPAKWADLAELGVLYALVPEDQGGFGGTGFDIALVFEALGTALCPEPILPALMAAQLLAAAGRDLEPLISGVTRYALAATEIEAPFDLYDSTTQAMRTGDTWQLSGRKSVVYGGGVADLLLVAAWAEGNIGLFEVSASEARITPYAMIDGGGAAEVFLDNTPATLVLANAKSALEDALDAGRLALCAEAIGAMTWCNATLLDYLKTRTQFGRTIGSFQVLQHRMVDLMIELEQARSITILAASRMGSSDQSRTLSMAKNLIGRTVKLVAEETIQMHGGIAMTWEYPASHYAKRLTMIDHQLGDTDDHLARVAAGYTA